MRNRKIREPAPGAEPEPASSGQLEAALPAWVGAEVALSPWAPKGLSAAGRAGRGASAAEAFLRTARDRGFDPLIAAQMVVAHNLARDLMARADAAGEGSPWHALYLRDGGRMATMFSRQIEALLGIGPEIENEPDP
jgi:hypothetical protein